MTTPRLNRIFTVTGSSTATERRQIPWGFNSNRGSGFADGEPGYWNAPSAFQMVVPDGALASVYAGMVNNFNLNPQSVNEDGTNQSDVPQIGALLDIHNRLDDGYWVRLRKPGLDSYVEWTVTEAYRSNAGVIRLNVPNDSGQLVGADFPIAYDDYVVFEFELRQADQSVTTTIDRRTWGELTERGSAIGVIDVTTVEAGQTLTGSQEEATAAVRYDPALAIGTALTDDLAREWLIRGSRTLKDRRYLEFDLTRQVLGIG